MAVIELPDTVRREIADLPRFEIQPSAVLDEVVLTAQVCGVPVAMYLSAATYPAEPPRIELLRGWSWSRREHFDRRRRIRGLECQLRWNRTLGIGAPLRELEVLFREQPPRRRQVSPRREGPSLLQRLVDAFERAVRWLRGLFRRSPAAAAKAAANRPATSPESVRARYEEVIREKSARVARYRQAVAGLITLWQQKTVRRAELGREIGELERRREEAVTASQEVLEHHRNAGHPRAEVEADADFRRGRRVYEQSSVALAEMRKEWSEVGAEADELSHKIREHEAQLEALQREVRELKEESAEMVAELTTVRLEREIVDALSGISRAGASEELEGLRRQLRKERAVVRITREVVDEESDDDAYLDVGRKMNAAREFEDKVGLGAAGEVAERLERE